MSEPITEQEIAELNRRAVERSSIIARMAGAALIAVGSIGMVAWAWTAVRTQQVVGPVGFGFGGGFDAPAPSLAERVDLAAGGVYVLVASAVAVGPGLLLRLAGDYAQSRVGGSITGYRAGDPFGEDDDGDGAHQP